MSLGQHSLGQKLQHPFVSRLPVMNHAPLTGDNYESANIFNKQFCKALPKESRKDIIAEKEKLVANDYVEAVHNLATEDKNLVSNTQVHHYMTQTVAYKESSQST